MGKGFIDLVKIAPIQYNKVVDTTKNKYSEVSLINYGKVGWVSCGPKSSIVIGYCKENPLVLFEKMFAGYVITNFNEEGLLRKEDMERMGMRRGLQINSVEKLFGIEGKFEDLIELEDINRAKRKKPFTNKYLAMVLQNLDCNLRRFNPDYNQIAYNRKQLSGVVRKFIC